MDQNLFQGLVEEMKREGVIRGGRGGAGQVGILGEPDNSIHSASHVISSPCP